MSRADPLDLDVVAAEVAARASEAGIFLDLDGTLAPIVSRPELATVLPEAPPVLGRLVGRVEVVAVVSGRPSAQVRELVGVEGLLAIGTHGLEDEAPMPPDVLRAIEAVAASVGAWVEAKGAAAAVHFRGLDDPRAAAEAAELALARVAEANGLELLGGKRILELIPSGRPRKGGAVERVVRERGLRAAMFVGDDIGDLDAFAALERLDEAGVWTCAVASAGPEVSPAVIDAADLVVDGPHGALMLLSAIADALEGESGRGTTRRS